MQIQNVTGVNFSSARLTPEVLEARAEALERGDFDIDKDFNPDVVADVLDGKLKKTEAGRKLVNSLASVAGFSAAALSFRRVAPKLRNGIAAATSNIAGRIGNIGAKVQNEALSNMAKDMTENTAKLSGRGDGTILRRGVSKLFGKNADSVMNGLGKIGIKTGGDVADTAIAVGAATLAGREVGDIADETQREATLKDTFRDLARVAGALGIGDTI